MKKRNKLKSFWDKNTKLICGSTFCLELPGVGACLMAGNQQKCKQTNTIRAAILLKMTLRLLLFVYDCINAHTQKK